MQYVVDSNFLRSEDLRDFLSRSRSNTVVLTDYAAMEAYKGDTLKSIFQSMAIPAEFPEQIIVLKGTKLVGALSGRTKGLRRRLINQEETKEFPLYCKALRVAQGGNSQVTSQILERGKWASEHLGGMLADMEGITDDYKGIEGTYTKDEIRKFRTGGPYSQTAIGKLFEHIHAFTIEMIRKHPHGVKLPRAQELPNTFIFRYAVCVHLLLVRWIRDGSNPLIKPTKLRNDIVDANFATFATYFDGLLSKDKKANEIHTEARYLLHQLGAAVSNPFEKRRPVR